MTASWPAIHAGPGRPGLGVGHPGRHCGAAQGPAGQGSPGMYGVRLANQNVSLLRLSSVCAHCSHRSQNLHHGQPRQRTAKSAVFMALLSPRGCRAYPRRRRRRQPRQLPLAPPCSTVVTAPRLALPPACPSRRWTQRAPRPQVGPVATVHGLRTCQSQSATPQQHST